MNARVVLVTGASSGIGRACATYLAGCGFRVYGTSRNPIPEQHQVTMLQMDVTDDVSVERAIDHIVQSEGHLDIVINNAGIAVAGPLEMTSIEEARHQLDVNLLGVFRVCRAVLPIMRTQGSGYIVNIGSIGGLIAIPFQPMYSASKFALEGMSEALRLEVRPCGIRVVIVEPGIRRPGSHGIARSRKRPCARTYIRPSPPRWNGWLTMSRTGLSRKVWRAWCAGL